MKVIEGGVCAAKGFKAGGVVAGFKKSNIEKNKKDLAVIYCEKECSAAALYTRNKVKGAPIIVTQKNLASTGGRARAIAVNSGNANTCNPDGVEIAEKVCALTAQSLGIDKSGVIVASTGVIGQKLDFAPFETGIPELVGKLSETGSADACDAIMTTDTRRKEYAVEFELDGVKARVGGICKGSGMINPNMATLLVFITTDANIGAAMLDKALREVNADTFNMICVDGDTSTNDMACVMASGLAGNAEITGENNGYAEFAAALRFVMTYLARETVRDGEGAKKLIECRVTGSPDEKTAKSIAKTVISSSLLKAALSAADANWGRILCAVGYADGDFEVDKIDVNIAGIPVCKNGAGVPFSEDEAFKRLSGDEIIIEINLNSGDRGAVAWGCDLTEEYVRINADYRS